MKFEEYIRAKEELFLDYGPGFFIKRNKNRVATPQSEPENDQRWHVSKGPGVYM